MGCGRIVEEAHAPALQALGDRARVVALADPSAERRRVVVDVLGQSDVAEFDNWQSMLEVGQIDAAVIALPHHLHTRAIVDAATAGVDVISEKPLATTLAEIDEIEDAVASAGIRLAVMHNWMFNPEPVRAIEAIGAGLIGVPFLVRNESLNGVRWVSRDPAGDWRHDRAKSGGGLVIDSIYHPIYVSEAELTSPIVRAYASLGGEQGDETRALILLEHENGGSTSIQRCSTAVGGGVGVHEVHGTKGSVRFRQADPLILNLIFAGNPPPQPTAAGPPAPALEIFEADTGEWRPLETQPGPWWGGIREVFARTLDAWADGQAPPADIQAARHVLAVVEAIYDSAERGEAVAVTDNDNRRRTTT
jgi:predicted dehydrogenase